MIKEIKYPEIEKEISHKKEENISSDEIDEEFEKCKKNPHKYICDWMGRNLLYVGEKSFGIISLFICSLMLPDINFNSTNIKASFNVLLLAPPSSGKSTICRKVEELSFNPYSIRKVSAYQLAIDLSNLEIFTLILEDFSQIGNDYDVIKVMEGAVGDERRISLVNKNTHVDANVRGIGLLCGTWNDLGRYFEYFKSGTLFRYNLLFLDLDEEEKINIGRYINDGIGNEKDSAKTKLQEKAVKKYYLELQNIMSGENKSIPQIKKYYFDENFKKEIFELWNKATKKYSSLDYNFNREMHEGYRIAVSSALLNIFNRKIDKDGMIFPEEQDFNIAKKFMINNINNKVAILNCRSLIKSSTAEEIRALLSDNRLSSTKKKILANLYGYKH
ncbi:MAG TPA: hypothetical protein VGB37_14580 [Candidatus Lokiarchaeia archaeon]